MIRVSARALIYFLLFTSRVGADLRQGAYSGQDAYFFFEKILNVQNKIWDEIICLIWRNDALK